MLKDDYDINIIGRQAMRRKTGERSPEHHRVLYPAGGTRFIYKEF